MRTPLGIVSIFLLAGTGAFAQQYTISTRAGGTPPPTPGAALNSPIGSPGALATDLSSNVYFIADDCVFKVDLSGNLTLIAGNSRVGFSGDGAAANQAQLYNPGGLAVDNQGNIYIADSGNNRIRKVTPSNGLISTIAGQPTAGYSGDTNAATSAQLNNPQGLAVDSSGNLYIADAGNHAIRKITVATGVITTIAGTGFAGTSVDGQTATSAQLNNPLAVGIDSLGNVYIADSNNHKIRSIIGGIMNTVAGTGVPGYSGDFGLAKVAQLNLPTQVNVDPNGVIYITDYNNQRVRKVAQSGIITTVAAAGSGLGTPSGIATDPSANLYVGDSTGSHVLKFASSGIISTYAGTGTGYYLGDGGVASAAQLVQPEGLAIDPQGIYIADKGEARIRKIQSNNNIVSPPGATGSGPAGVAVDSGENIYIADAPGNRVLKVAPSGQVTLIAGTGIPGPFGDNGQANLAQLNQPSGVALDPAGNIYIADTGNHRIRKVTLATGIITTIAGSNQGYGGDNQIATAALLNAPAGLTLDNNGNIFVADTGNNRIREISATTGIITTVAGNGNNAYSGDNGPATQAAISSPHGVAVDSRFNLYIPDFSGRVRKVATSGIITTIAGSATPGYSGDGGPALSAQLSQPWGITVDASGNVIVSDIGEQAVRQLSPVASTSLAVQTTSLPNGVVGTAYAQTLTATGGTLPYTWTSSTLPAGLTLSSSGSITGTPTVAGTFFINFQVTDSGSFTAQVAIGLTIAGSAPNGLSISTSPLLIPGAVGVSYYQPLVATSGNPPYNWTPVSGSLPAGLTLSANGVISGVPTTPGTSTFSIRVNDNSGAIATQTFTLNIISVGTLTQTGALGHIAVGGSWTTRVYLTNISNAPLAVSLLFYGDNGGPATIPFTVTQQGGTQQLVANTYNAVLNANTALVINSGANIPNTVTGWIQVLSSGAANSMAGYAIFETPVNTTTSEGTATLQTNLESKMDLPFDDTGGYVTGVAVANASASATTVTATVYDNNGNQLGAYNFPLPAYGHTSFLFPTQFAVTGNQQGLVQFQSSSGGPLSGVGLRANTASGSFTSVPVILP
jgi:sugar lactone lactonase YvrE